MNKNEVNEKVFKIGVSLDARLEKLKVLVEDGKKFEEYFLSKDRSTKKDEEMTSLMRENLQKQSEVVEEIEELAKMAKKLREEVEG